MFKKQAVFDQLPDRPMSHCSYLVNYPNGMFQVAWFSGAFETAEDMVLLTATKNKLDEHWSKPELLVIYPEHAVGQPVLFLHPNGELWLFYVVVMNTKKIDDGNKISFNALPSTQDWITAQPFLKKSYDMGESWGNPEQIIDFPGLMFRSRPLVIEDRIIVPAYDENTWQSRMLVSDNGGHTWRLLPPIKTSAGNIHATLVRMPDDHILAYLRPGGDGGVVWKTESFDDGEAWTDAKPTQIPNPNSGFDLLGLKNGKLLLAFNDSKTKRTPLCVAISEQDEKWSLKRIIEKGDGEYSYPSLIQSEDGCIHMTYTYQRRHIEFASFSENWLYDESEGNL